MERNGFQHGFPPEAWQRAKDEARQVMYATARRKRTVSYSDLVAKVSAVQMEAHDPRLAHFLGEIAREDEAYGLGLTTVLVVHKHGDTMPGPGFFEMAVSLGREVEDNLQFWSIELNRVHDQWSEKN